MISDSHFFRVTETNWKKWKSDLGVKLKEDPANHLMEEKTDNESSGRTSVFIKSFISTTVSCC